jgi:chaperonin cofactor prefoldin
MDTSNSYNANSQSRITNMKKVNNNFNEIRNLTHDYHKIDTETKSYELFANLKSNQRMDHLDAIEEYETWKINYLNSTEDKIKRKIDQLKDHLDKTQYEINSQFSMKNEELISLILNDITKIEMNFYQIISRRNDEIQNARSHIMDVDEECKNTVENKIFTFKKELIEIGFRV